jgi:Ca2+-transporting ATPase
MLVPGDVVLLEAGNRIPADVRFIETHQLKVDESTLTGESNTIDKRQRNYRWRVFPETTAI